jgi:hypothetical protein
MNSVDGERFRNLMLGMADNFRDSISREGMRLRWEMLKQYTIEQVEQAGLQIMKSRKFTKMPPVAEFIDAIEGERVPIELQAEQQWNEIISQIRSVGSYGTPVFRDPATKALIGRRFSWQNLCQSTENDLRFFRKEFIAAYSTEHAFSDGGLIEYHHQDARLTGLVDNMIDEIPALTTAERGKS